MTIDTAACNCTGPLPGSMLCPCMMKRVNSRTDHWLTTENDLLKREVEALREQLNTPEVKDFARGVELEAAHQRERWGSSHDAGKTGADWFWLIGYLAQKVLYAETAGDHDKALHHCISTAAALANWHAAISGVNNEMRPGIAEPENT